MFRFIVVSLASWKHVYDSSAEKEMKKDVRGRPPKKVKAINTSEVESDLAYDVYCHPEGNGQYVPHRKMPQRAAACLNFKEKDIILCEELCKIEPKTCHVEEKESVAVQLTRSGPEIYHPRRRLVEFIFQDVDRKHQQIEVSEITPLYITALIMPVDTDLMDKEKGVMCECFGPIMSWSISGYGEGTAVVQVSTEVADYQCVKPKASYKRMYNLFYGKACICVDVYQKLSRSQGGKPDLSLDELLAKVARSMSGNKSVINGSMTIDFVLSHGDFIYCQLRKLEKSLTEDDVNFATLPVLVALKDEHYKRLECMKLPVMHSECLKIDDEKQVYCNEHDDDEKLARLLQQEEEWKVISKHRNLPNSSNRYYIKISEDEIADDYPCPAYYRPFVEEMDEYMFFEAYGGIHYPDELPTMIIQNWSLYNSDSRFVSLELLPMKPCAEIDVAIFGSGHMREDDGSGFCLEADPCHTSSSASTAADVEGVPIYLSTIKEWKIEYRLGSPTKQYAPWYEPILKTAKLARSMIILLKEQSRASKLSFSDVIKKVSEFEKDNPAHISSKVAAIERYTVVHGQIILQQFAEFPDEIIKRCAFVTGLLNKMKERHHTKLDMRKKMTLKRGANLNPSASMVPVKSKRTMMRATMTKLINKIWGDYYAKHDKHISTESDSQMSKEKDEIEEEPEENEEDPDVVEEEILIQMDDLKPHSSIEQQIPSSNAGEKRTKWQGESTGKKESGEPLYRCALVNGDKIVVGGAVVLEVDDHEEVPAIVYVEYMFEKSDGTKMVHGKVMQRGSQTVLGNAANDREIFLTNDCRELELVHIKEPIALDFRLRPWGHAFRKENAKNDEFDKAKADERKRKGLPVEYYCKSLYWPQKGAFFTLPVRTMGLGDGTCHSCITQKEKFKINSSGTCFVHKKTEYKIQDFVYARYDYIDVKMKDEDHGTFKAGRNVGLKPYVICQILEICIPKVFKGPTPDSTKVKVRRFYRSEDVSVEKGYSSDVREVYYSEEIVSIYVEAIEGKCHVGKRNELPDLDFPMISAHIFFCDYSYDPKSGSIKQLPPNIKIKSQVGNVVQDSALTKNKGKGKCKEGEEKDEVDQSKGEAPENRLVTLDIFAGCGGLSEGLQKSGVSITKWAIEYDQAAGEAFSRNHAETAMFIHNCNVILRAIMDKCGDGDECISTAEATELAGQLSEEKLNNLPLPGNVDFINGGPPCQGFSGMNRFNKSPWSRVQCEMILAFLSFADYFRPRFFLLENVRNFVSFNKGQTFCLTLASLLEMGYQVRFGILEAGAFGVSQSRKRAFIWAASPEETLPEWPEPMHVFAGPELKISLSPSEHYAAVRSTAGGAPFRSITVRDAIGDLPSVGNGASNPLIDYGNDPISWFQKHIRGRAPTLSDHITKEMNELNLIRCQRIPKRPGADWRDLPDEKVKLSTGQVVDLIPWCLPNTAKRHNEWKGLFGRLDWEGNFPTSITDPQPMGKVGMCFHPEQDRILTVRELARSQGFPDSYYFSGNIQDKYKQIGNAVPPPLAYALGRKLKQAVEAKRPGTPLRAEALFS
ncbi:hypothetical protein Taro_024602 [Colocasia esculenta]|uniref:DNA (cytosine-5)-methyltransferase n=1 Tax=Colocasia esculenta TaxID=4460 RepID=A0A843VEZ0_COLES|nr:hypothetical protein [Colocasia esculenta]